MAAPFLFGLAGLLIKVITNLSATLGGVGRASAISGFALSFTGTGVTYSDFRLFALLSLTLTSFFSACIIATIKKGDIKSGFKYIPIFIAISIILFFMADVMLGKLMGVFI